MCSANRESLEVSWRDLFRAEHLLAEWLADAPAEMLPILDEVRPFLEIFRAGHLFSPLT